MPPDYQIYPTEHVWFTHNDEGKQQILRMEMLEPQKVLVFLLEILLEQLKIEVDKLISIFSTLTYNSIHLEFI